MTNKQCNDFCDYLLGLKEEAECVDKLSSNKRKKAEEKLMSKTIIGVVNILNGEGDDGKWK